MRHRRWLNVSLLTMAAFGGCDDASTTPADAGATGRAIRGRLPEFIAGYPVTRVYVIDASNGRTVASAVPDAMGRFNIDSVPAGATYRLSMQVNGRAVPLVFPQQQGGDAKTNLFNVGSRGARRAGALDGPIDVSDVRTSTAGGAIQTAPANPSTAPNMQEDLDGDGMPDGADMDVDGDGTTNAMDEDDNGDGMSDRQQFGDQDGDGVTNESDTDQDGDGTDDESDDDDDGDGMPDAMDMTPKGNSRGTTEDTDGDGVPNSEDMGGATNAPLRPQGRGGTPLTPSGPGASQRPAIRISTRSSTR